MHNYILEGKNLSKSYLTQDNKELKACKNIDFHIKKGETVGIIGESGCGKSTLLKMITRLEKPTSGDVFFNSENITNLRGSKLKESRKNIQMIFQDPSTSFSPRMKVYDALLEPINNFYKLSKSEKQKKVEELLNKVHLPTDYSNRLCLDMSGGQRQRLAIARALSLDPDVLVCDESTSALDVSIQQNIIELLVDLQKQRDLSIIFVCHDIALVSLMSHRIIIMYLGCIVEEINSCELDYNAKHPYSKLLISSVFSTSMDFDKEIKILDTDIPSPINTPDGCVFSTRCEHCMDVCIKVSPKLKTIGDNHKIACHLF